MSAKSLGLHAGGNQSLADMKRAILSTFDDQWLPAKEKAIERRVDNLLAAVQYNFAQLERAASRGEKAATRPSQQTERAAEEQLRRTEALTSAGASSIPV